MNVTGCLQDMLNDTDHVNSVSFFRKVDTARQQITHEEAIEINNQFGEAAPADFVELKLELGAGRAINTALFTAPPQPPAPGAAGASGSS